MQKLYIIIFVVIAVSVTLSAQDKKDGGGNPNKHGNNEPPGHHKKNKDEIYEYNDEQNINGPPGHNKVNNGHHGNSNKENINGPPGHNKDGKHKKPPPPQRSLKWKPKPQKGHPPPPKGFSGYRPHGWGKGGNHYNDRGEKDRRKSQRKYEEYMINIFGEEDYEENDILLPEELNGREIARPGEYPHAAAIGVETESNKKIIEWKCGGSLIAEQFILTAAHCTNFGGQSPTHVKIGDIFLKARENTTEPQRIRIAEIIPHPYYNTESYYYDIALIKLVRPAIFTRFVRPVRLWTSADVPFETVFAMGYGATQFGHAPTNILTFLNFTLIGNEECNNTFPAIPETEYGIIDSQMCAMDRIGTKDTCQGDSGGPLQLNLPGRKRARYSLIGVTSYGLICGTRTPSVYTRVYSYLDWLEETIWPDEPQVPIV